MSSAVLVMDMQRGLFDREPRPYEADGVIERINGITDRARAAAVPVIFTQAEYPGFLDAESEGWQFTPALKVQADDVLMRKPKANAFLETGLADRLTGQGVNHVIICGYATEFCVDSTARYASALGFSVQLVADGHTTHDKQHLSAEKIREHHNLTLSMSPTVTALPAVDTIPLGGNGR